MSNGVFRVSYFVYMANYYVEIFYQAKKNFLPAGRKNVSDACAKHHPDVIKHWNAWNRMKLNTVVCFY